MPTGRCACGDVRYTAAGPLRDVYNCHCERCRRITGHHMAATATRTTNLTLVAQHTLKWFEPAEGVYYGFCGGCGSTLFWRTDADLGHISIAAGTLDQPTGLCTTQAWWVAEAGDYYTRQPGLAEFEYET